MITLKKDFQNIRESLKTTVVKRGGAALRFVFTGRRQKILSALFLLVSITIIGLILRANWQLIETYRQQLRPAWLLGIAVFFAIDLLLAGWAWHLLAARLANYRNFRRSMKITWYANLARRMPGPIWYIAGRAVLYEEEGVSKRTTSLLSGLEMVFFLVSGLVTVGLTLPFWVLPENLSNNVIQSWSLLLLAALGVLLVHPHILESVWHRVSRDTPSQQLRWSDTIAWLALYIVVWAVGGLILFSIINVFQPLALNHFMAVLGTWALSNSLSLAGTLTLTGIGVREVSLTLLLTQFVPAPIGLLIALAVRVVWIVGEAASALISLKL